MNNPGPLARFEAIKGDESAPLQIFSRLAEGESLKQIAKAWEVPKGRFCEWFTSEHGDLYDAALKVRAAELAIEALEEAHAANPEDVAVRKLRADVALKIAGKWDRQRYGESVQVRHSGETVVKLQFGLPPTVGRVIEQSEQVVVLPGAVRAVEDI